MLCRDILNCFYFCLITSFNYLITLINTGVCVIGIISYIVRHYFTSVREDKTRNIVYITNINTANLIQDLVKVWDTKVITKYMLDNVTKESFSINSFFIPDLYYSVSQILLSKKYKSQKNELKRLLDGLKDDTWYSNYFLKQKSKLNYNKLLELKFTLKPLQLDVVKAYDYKTQALKLNGLLLNMGVGSGKTLTGIAIANCLEPDVVFIICPKSLIDTVWVDGINEQFPVRKKKIWSANAGLPLKRGYDFYIFNYEALGSAVLFSKQYKFIKPVILLDESQNLNNVKSKRTRQFLLMCQLLNSKDIIFESGTPIDIYSSGTIPLFKAIDPLFTDSVELKFISIFSRSANRVLELLKNRLGMLSQRVTSKAISKLKDPIVKDVKIKIPNSKIYTLSYIKEEYKEFVKVKTNEYKRDMDIYERIFTNCLYAYKKTISSKSEYSDYLKYVEYVKIIRGKYNGTIKDKELSKKDLNEMINFCSHFEQDKIMKKLTGELKENFKNAVALYKYYRMVILGQYLGVLGKKRIECHTKLIEYGGLDKIVNKSIKKTIVFSDFVDTALAAKKYFEDRGFKPSIVYGETTKDIANILESFKKSNLDNPLVATVKTLSAGATLVVANTIIFLNPPYRARDAEQAIARAQRIGQDTQVYVFNLLLDTGREPNLSTRMLEINAFSADQMEKIAGTNTKLMNKINSLSYYEELLNTETSVIGSFFEHLKNILGLK